MHNVPILIILVIAVLAFLALAVVAVTRYLAPRGRHQGLNKQRETETVDPRPEPGSEPEPTLWEMLQDPRYATPSQATPPRYGEGTWDLLRTRLAPEIDPADADTMVSDLVFSAFSTPPGQRVSMDLLYATAPDPHPSAQPVYEHWPLRTTTVIDSQDTRITATLLLESGLGEEVQLVITVELLRLASGARMLQPGIWLAQ